MLWLFGLAAVLSVVHFFSESYAEHVERWHTELVSFSSGLAIAFIFLYLLPEVMQGSLLLGSAIFAYLLAGFVGFHVAEKYLYQHITHKKKLLKDLAFLHISGFFIYHFIVGVTLFVVFAAGFSFKLLLLFFAFILHTLSSSLSLNHIDEYFKGNVLSNLVMSLSPVFGVGFAMVLGPAAELRYPMLAFVVGAVTYVVSRDLLPYGESGKPAFFIIGVVLSCAALWLAGVFG